DVRHVAEVVAGEHRADAAECANGLIGDQQYIVLIADLAHPVEVARWRREAAARVLHRLKEDCGYRIGPFEFDGFADAFSSPQPEVLLVIGEHFRRTIEVRVRYAEGARDQWLERGLHIRQRG